MKPTTILYVSLLFFGCRHTTAPPPPIHISTVQLTLEDALCTEVWLKLAFTDSSGARDFALLRKDAGSASQILCAGRVGLNDTTLLDTTAEPATNYTYVAYRLNGSTLTDYSADLAVTTMATTSHSFTWQIDTLGSGNSSYLKDVAIIDDNNIWAVGATYLKDSTGLSDPNAYNVAHWNGQSWDLMRSWFYTICGQQHLSSYGASSILAFGSNDIWIAMDGSQVARWNGSSQVTTMCLPYSFSISKMWGPNSSSIYAVGSAGTIMHYDGSSWQKTESGTTVDLRDVWGTSDGKTVWACGYSNDLSQSVLLRHDGSSWSTQWSTQGGAWMPPYGQLVLSVWSGSSYLYVAATDGIYRTSLRVNGPIYHVLTLTWVPFRIRGSAENNVSVVVGDGSIWHYGGNGWAIVQAGNPLKGFYSLSVAAKTLVAVGDDATTIDVKGRTCVGRAN